jgi:hypothetical protein
MATQSVTTDVPVPGATEPQATPETTESQLFTQTYSFRIPKTMDALFKEFTQKDKDGKDSINEKAILYTIRAGMKQVLNNRARQLFTERVKDGENYKNPAEAVFQPQVEIYDVTPLILAAPQRTGKSQRDKLVINLQAAGLPQAAIDNMLATFDANVGAADTGEYSVQTVQATMSRSKDGKLIVMKVGVSEDEEEE